MIAMWLTTDAVVRCWQCCAPPLYIALVHLLAPGWNQVRQGVHCGAELAQLYASDRMTWAAGQVGEGGDPLPNAWHGGTWGFNEALSTCNTDGEHVSHARHAGIVTALLRQAQQHPRFACKQTWLLRVLICQGRRNVTCKRAWQELQLQPQEDRSQVRRLTGSTPRVPVQNSQRWPPLPYERVRC